MGSPKSGLPYRLMWFALLWLAGVSAVAIAALIIKWMLAI
jgi:hypothetical protein